MAVLEGVLQVGPPAIWLSFYEIIAVLQVGVEVEAAKKNYIF